MKEEIHDLKYIIRRLKWYSFVEIKINLRPAEEQEGQKSWKDVLRDLPDSESDEEGSKEEEIDSYLREIAEGAPSEQSSASSHDQEIIESIRTFASQVDPAFIKAIQDMRLSSIPSLIRNKDWKW